MESQNSNQMLTNSKAKFKIFFQNGKPHNSITLILRTTNKFKYGNEPNESKESEDCNYSLKILAPFNQSLFPLLQPKIEPPQPFITSFNS